MYRAATPWLPDLTPVEGPGPATQACHKQSSTDDADHGRLGLQMSCTIVKHMVAVLQPEQLRPWLERLLLALLPALGHQHSKTRLAVLTAVHCLAQQASSCTGLALPAWWQHNCSKACKI